MLIVMNCAIDFCHIQSHAVALNKVLNCWHFPKVVTIIDTFTMHISPTGVYFNIYQLGIDNTFTTRSVVPLLADSVVGKTQLIEMDGKNTLESEHVCEMWCTYKYKQALFPN